MITVSIAGENVDALKAELLVVNRMINYTVEPIASSTTVRKNRPGQGRKVGSKGRKKSKGVEKKKPIVEAIAETPVEVATPANQHIMDQFQKDQEAKGEAVSAVDDLDNLLAGQEEAKPISAKNPTYEDVAKQVTDVINAMKAKGKNPVPVVQDILAGFQVKKVGDLDKGHWSHFIQKCKSVI